MNVWITTVGWSEFAVINPLWAACFFEGEKKFIPEKVILLNNGWKNATVRKNLDIVKHWLTKILIEYGVEEPIIESVDADEEDINSFFRIFKEKLQNHKNDTIAIDMTPGRKFMSSIAMNLAIKNKVDKLYYLQLWGQEYQHQPFIKIPFINQRLINVMELLNE